jgi:hypothetical protein
MRPFGRRNDGFPATYIVQERRDWRLRLPEAGYKVH